MDSSLKVTDQSDEEAFSEMVAGDNVINIPLFQRAYRWKAANLGEFWDDIDSILDEASRSHFLGVLVLVPQSRKVGQPAVIDVVDGQQRLTTCYLTIMAMAYAATENGQVEWAQEVIRSYLLTRSFSGYSTNTRLVPSAADRQQFHDLWGRMRALSPFSKDGFGGLEVSTPQPSGTTTGSMKKAFELSLKRCRQILNDEGFERLEKIFEIVFGKLSFVTINLRSPTAAPAIFERLNARGERINISDLVRNEVFSRVADDAAVARSMFESYWEPFVQLFSEKHATFEGFLFPYGLTIKPSITKADLFALLREHWSEKSGPVEIVNAMRCYVAPYQVLETGQTSLEIDEHVLRSFQKLHRLRVPSTTYSFLFRLSLAVSQGELDGKKASDIVDVIESFLFRRAICGFEPSGLHAVFKTLWSECSKSSEGVTARSVSKSISRRTTVPWPNNDEFSQAIQTGDLYSRRVNKYAVLEREIATVGETPEDDFHIEHIFPQKPSTEWSVTEIGELSDYLNCWANLIPLTTEMNPSVSNSHYSKKRTEFAKSIFSAPREIAKDFEEWGAAELKMRAEDISNWALKRWPHQRFEPE